MKTITVVVVLLLVALSLFGEFMTAQDLVDGRDAWDKVERGGHVPYDILQAGRYAGFLLGVADTMIGTGVIDLPERTTVGALMQAVSNYIDAHPERWTGTAMDLVALAFLELFPAPERQTEYR